MFGFSIPKIALLLLIIFLIWQMFKILEKRKNIKDNFSNNEEEEENDFYEALTECKKCGNFYSKEDSLLCPVCNRKTN